MCKSCVEGEAWYQNHGVLPKNWHEASKHVRKKTMFATIYDWKARYLGPLINIYIEKILQPQCEYFGNKMLPKPVVHNRVQINFIPITSHHLMI